ncbi:MAG TPA: response regulator transcription factor [Pseudonocardiaceae bacterium]|nr:response regulator transcription factor [Pseudonocardiaceae bacterium]
MTIKILLVDDEPLLRMGFRLVLESQDDIEVVGEASDGAVAIRQTVALDPDVVLMDVRMPGMDGIEATIRIVRERPRSRVLILTTFDLDEYAFTALRSGASGFLLKNVPPEDLLSAIRAVASGDAVVAPSVTRRLLDTMAPRLPDLRSQTPCDAEGKLARLTEREVEVLTKVAGGLSNAEIAEQLHVTEATVKTHVGRILGKLELRDRVQAVVYAYEIRLVVPS